MEEKGGPIDAEILANITRDIWSKISPDDFKNNPFPPATPELPIIPFVIVVVIGIVVSCLGSVVLRKLTSKIKQVFTVVIAKSTPEKESKERLSEKDTSKV